jgi:hypothetical protein
MGGRGGLLRPLATIVTANSAHLVGILVVAARLLIDVACVMILHY